MPRHPPHRFLGSGKRTTRLNRILKEQHSQRIAVIDNGFGEAGIDKVLHLDRVTVEATGLADPAPTAQTFFVDDDIGQQYLRVAIWSASASPGRHRHRAALVPARS